MIHFDLQKIISKLVYDPKDPLLFNSGFFLFFLLAFLVFYQFVYKKKLTRVILFTLFSWYFFYKACGWYFLFIVLAAMIDFNLSNFIYVTRHKGRRAAWLLLSLTINLGLLFYFKYTDFFISIWNDLSQHQLQPLHLALPIGISFYTFENISYTIDVYHNKFKPVKSFLDYCFFLSFFPKLVMGPIVRASDFVPQIRQDIFITREAISTGLYLIISGLFRKVVISDYIYVNFVQHIFEAPQLHSGVECLLGVYGYALVIYCDFSGYSDMAIGMAKWMGFTIPTNFDSPYQSASITEFWRRWHISLSSWLRDYLYIPLGGNRKGKFRQYINLFLTMLIGGLWHGASWNFILWGGMHGLALAIDKLIMEKFRKGKNKIGETSIFLRIPGIVFTFHFVCFCWIFFKAANFSDAGMIIHQIFYNFNGGAFVSLISGYPAVFLLIGIGYLLHFLPHNWELKTQELFSRISLAGRILVLLFFVWLVIQVKTAEAVMPIYLQF